MRDEQRRGPGVSQDGEAATGGATAPPEPPSGSGVSAAHYVETARQLMGKAGERQVKNCRYVYQNTMGGSGFNNIATIWGREI